MSDAEHVGEMLPFYNTKKPDDGDEEKFEDQPYKGYKGKKFKKLFYPAVDN